jgi:GT2 family glycosyltransferase
MPAVSVILPTHNRAATVGRAIKSVLASTFSDLELIVVDDGSTDQTAAVVSSYADPRMRFVRLDANRGVAAARNAGIAAATSEWLAFQDSDDEWIDTKLEAQMALATKAPAKVGVIIGGYLVADGDKLIEIRPEASLAERDPTPDILDGWPTITPTWVVRSQAVKSLGGFDESFGCLEDWDLMFRLSAVWSMRAVPGPILVKHGSADSVCAPPERMRDSLKAILARHGARWRGHPRRLGHRLRHLALLEYQLGARSVARRTVARAIARDPLAPAGFALLAAMSLGSRAVRTVEQWWAPQVTMRLPTG